MSTNVILTSEKPTLSWWGQFAKITLFKLLNRLQTGHLTLIEGDSTYTFGESSSTLHAQVMIHDPTVYSRILVGGGSLAAGETYVEGLWDTPDITKVVQLLIRNREVLDELDHGFSFLSQWGHRIAHTLRPNSKRGSKQNIVAHYDLGNDFYRLFLDETMLYSSAIFPTASTSLYDAQLHKLDTICQRLQLRPHEHLMEIGTGWGALAIHAATHYGVKVTTTTISEAQHQYVEQLIQTRGLSDRITLLKHDYRDLSHLDGHFDKLVSVEMIEAVGHQHLGQFFKVCHQLLKPQGRLLIQAITIADQRYDRYRKQADFIQRYVFPGGFLPSITVMSEHLTRHTDLKITALTDIGLDYALTLNQWSERLATRREALPALGLDERFYRLWQFYLRYCEGGFRERLISTVHLVADKPQFHHDSHPIHHT
jgi:cyclopropane-fatty-acyl-phospholipid synthase